MRVLGLVEGAKSRAFTLLEILVSMSIMVILFTLSVNALVTVSDMSGDMVNVHQEELFSNALYSVCKKGFDSMGGQSSVEFDYADRGDRKFDTFLILTNSPDAFNINLGQTRRIDHACLAAEHRADGWLRIGVYYFSDFDYRAQREDSFSDLRNIPYLQLIDQVEGFVWEFYDATREQWFNEIDGFAPQLVRLEVTKPDTTVPHRYVFSIR